MPRAPPSFLSAFWDSLNGQSPAKEANPPTQSMSSPNQRERHAQEPELSPKAKPKPKPVETEIETKTKPKPKRGSAAAAVEDATDDAVLVPRQDDRQDNNSPRKSRNQQGTAAATTKLAPPGSSHHAQLDTPRPQAKRRCVEEHDTAPKKNKTASQSSPTLPARPQPQPRPRRSTALKAATALTHAPARPAAPAGTTSPRGHQPLSDRYDPYDPDSMFFSDGDEAKADEAQQEEQRKRKRKLKQPRRQGDKKLNDGAEGQAPVQGGNSSRPTAGNPAPEGGDPAGESDSDGNDDGGEQLYEIDTILDFRPAPTSSSQSPQEQQQQEEEDPQPLELELLVRWKGFPDPSDHTWEGEAELQRSCRGAVLGYWASHPAGGGRDGAISSRSSAGGHAVKSADALYEVLRIIQGPSRRGSDGKVRRNKRLRSNPKVKPKAKSKTKSATKTEAEVDLDTDTETSDWFQVEWVGYPDRTWEPHDGLPEWMVRAYLEEL